jgi:hypothetical protein
MSNPPVGWQKVWFFLKNDADVLLLVFTGCCPIPQPKWGYDVAQQYIRRIQPLHDVIWQLLQGELTGADLLWTFVSRHIQQLRRWEMGDDNVDVSVAKLSHPLLPHRVG